MVSKKLQKILRPDMEKVHMGLMKVNESKCKKCEICFAMENCPFRAWEIGPNGFPVVKKIHECFSCMNCLVACPNKAVEIVDTYHVDEGYFETLPHPLAYKEPLDPKDADGNKTEWNEIEKAVFKRRSTRNFNLNKPVPETLIQRILEAGRFAPSGGNCQPWKFIVITNRALIKEINDEVTKIIDFFYNTYINDELVNTLAPVIEGMPGNADPRIVLGGMGSIARNKLDPQSTLWDDWLANKEIKSAGYPFAPVSLLAPAMILLVGDRRSIGPLEMNMGICGQNMTLVANSLGIGACWNSFVGVLLNQTPLRRKLGIKKHWEFISCLCLGYPKFKQQGIVPREYRPVTWFREGKEEPEIQD
ncbi:MAG: nitroreductase family protein [Promethearchaeota archaeon]